MQIRIEQPTKLLLSKFSKVEQEFYFKYAEIVQFALNLPEVQPIVSLMKERESLNLEEIRDVRIMIFPHGSTNFEQKCVKYLEIGYGMTCAGTYNSATGTISIYPIVTELNKKTIDFLTDREVRKAIALRSIATFFEEILHTKYNTNYMKRMNLNRKELEKEVRQKADEYTNIFIDNSNRIRKG